MSKPPPSRVPDTRPERGIALLVSGTADSHRLSAVLERAAHRVLRAADGPTAIDVLRREAVDVVCMSGRAGFEMLARCAALSPRAGRILVVSRGELLAELDSPPDAAGEASVRVVLEAWPESTLLACVQDELQLTRLRRECARLAGALEQSQTLLEALSAAARQNAPDGYRSEDLRDPLTGLPNRMLMLDRLDHAIRQAARSEDPVAVILFGIDRFKLINSGLGQRAGDQLLQALAGRLQGETRSGDSLARIGGDEFGFVLGAVRSDQQIAAIASRLGHVLEAPFLVQGREIFVSASMGISVFPADGRSCEDLLRGADAALHNAKKRGGGCYQFHSAETDEFTHRRITLEAELRRAIEREEFVLYYQPRIRAHDSGVTGAEALLRWRHPERGIVPPAEFIPVLEDTGLIAPVGRWVLQEACRTLRRWAAGGIDRLSLSVNLSPRQFTLCDLVEDVSAALGSAGLRMSEAKLELEVTESLMLSDYTPTVQALRIFREAGIPIAMDDFGTGYSSLSYLSSLPLDVLKIDRSFTAKLGQSRQAEALVVAIIAMGHSLGLRVVAEGVETREQFEFLRSHETEEVQGYLFGAPMDEEQFVEQLPALAQAS